MTLTNLDRDGAIDSFGDSVPRDLGIVSSRTEIQIDEAGYNPDLDLLRINPSADSALDYDDWLAVLTVWENLNAVPAAWIHEPRSFDDLATDPADGVGSKGVHHGTYDKATT